MNWSGETVTVFGGSGFLGNRIVRQLVKLNCGKIKCFNRSATPDLEKLGVEIMRGDIRESGAVNDACRGSSAVIHTSAKAGIWGLLERLLRH